MQLQRQHFLLSYFKIPSVDPAGVQTRDILHDSLMLNETDILLQMKICYNHASVSKYIIYSFTVVLILLQPHWHLTWIWLGEKIHICQVPKKLNNKTLFSLLHAQGKSKHQVFHLFVTKNQIGWTSQ